MALDRSQLRALVLRARDAQEDLSSRHAAFNRLVTLLQDFATGVAYAVLRDTGLAEDAAQESFVIAWRRLHALRDANLFVPWLKQIIARQCHRHLRKKSAQFTELEEAPDQREWEALVTRKERDRLIREALAHLPPGERQVVALAYFSRRSHAAIAAFLGLPPTTVAKRLASAKRRLKAALDPLRATIDRARPSRDQRFAAMVRAGIYNDYVGSYRFDQRPELTVEVKRVGNRLVSFSAGQKNTVLLGSRLSELRAREFDGRAQFVRDRTGRVSHFIYFEFGKRMGTAHKV